MNTYVPILIADPNNVSLRHWNVPVFMVLDNI